MSIILWKNAKERGCFTTSRRRKTAEATKREETAKKETATIRTRLEETARQMKQLGMPNQQIAAMTGLSEEEIEEL